MKKATFIAAAMSLLIFCGCGENQGENSDNPDYPEISTNGYNIVSDGTSVHIPELSEDLSDNKSKEANFYIPDGMVTRYGSEQLDSEELGVYNSLTEAVGNFEKSVPLKKDGGTYSDLLNLMSIEQLSFSHLVNRTLGEYNTEKKGFDVIFEYRFSPDDMSNMNRASEAVADNILSGITADMTDYDKLKYIHDYLIRNCESDTEDEYANTIYGTLVRKKALCEGYSKTFSYLCNRLGIENVIVTGKTNVPHMWNMVKVDGNWYHIDVTWDKPSGPLNEAYPSIVLYQYFMVTDSVIENDHTIIPIVRDVPRAYGTKENYFVKEGFYIKKDNEVVSVFEKAFDKAVENRESSVSLKFDTSNLLMNTIQVIKQSSKDGGGGIMKQAIENVSKKYNVKLNVSWTEYYMNYRVLLFTIDYVDKSKQKQP